MSRKSAATGLSLTRVIWASVTLSSAVLMVNWLLASSLSSSPEPLNGPIPGHAPFATRALSLKVSRLHIGADVMADVGATAVGAVEAVGGSPGCSDHIESSDPAGAGERSSAAGAAPAV